MKRGQKSTTNTKNKSDAVEDSVALLERSIQSTDKLREDQDREHTKCKVNHQQTEKVEEVHLQLDCHLRYISVVLPDYLSPPSSFVH